MSYIGSNSGEGSAKMAELLAKIEAGGIGAGQTWIDVKSSRALSTIYTNSTDKSIIVMVTIHAFAMNGTNINIKVNGLQLDSAYQSDTQFKGIMSTAVIPSGSTYEVSANNANISKWAELR